MTLLDPAAREREYSPSSVIGGDYSRFIERYRAASDAALRTLPVQRHLRYGPAPRALVDVFPAPPALRSPGLLVYLHGGYWQELSKNESAFLAPAWHAAGVAHAVVGYTLAPDARLRSRGCRPRPGRSGSTPPTW
jgi:arylformamidase